MAKLTKTKILLRAMKLAKLFVKVVSRKVNAATTAFNPQGTEISTDATLNIVQLIGAGIIVTFFSFYRWIIHLLDKETDADSIEKRALLGLVTGISLATTTGKALPKSFLSGLWNTTAGLVSGLLGAILFAAIPNLNSTDKNNLDDLKIGLKLGAIIMTGIGFIANKFLSGFGAIASLATVGVSFLFGAIVGAKLFPKIATYFAKKNDPEFAERAQIGLYCGATFGASIGAFLGTCIFPGVGTFLGSVIGAAVGSIVTTIATVACKPIYHYLKSKEMLFAAKVGGIIGAGIGGLIFTFLIPIPGVGTSVGVTIGSFVGTIACACAAKICSHINTIFQSTYSPPEVLQEKNNAPAANKNDNLSRYKLGVSCGTLVGTAVGMLVGGPIGALIGAAAGALFGLMVAGINSLCSRGNKNNKMPEEMNSLANQSISSDQQVRSALQKKAAQKPRDQIELDTIVDEDGKIVVLPPIARSANKSTLFVAQPNSTIIHESPVVQAKTVLAAS